VRTRARALEKERHKGILSFSNARKRNSEAKGIDLARTLLSFCLEFLFASLSPTRSPFGKWRARGKEKAKERK